MGFDPSQPAKSAKEESSAKNIVSPQVVSSTAAAPEGKGTAKKPDAESARQGDSGEGNNAQNARTQGVAPKSAPTKGVAPGGSYSQVPKSSKEEGKGDGDDDDGDDDYDDYEEDNGEWYCGLCNLPIDEITDGVVGTVCCECNEVFHSLCHTRHLGWCPACSAPRPPGIPAFSTEAPTFVPAGPAQQSGEPAPTPQQTTTDDNDLKTMIRLLTEQKQLLQ